MISYSRPRCVAISAPFPGPWSSAAAFSGTLHHINKFVGIEQGATEDQKAVFSDQVQSTSQFRLPGRAAKSQLKRPLHLSGEIIFTCLADQSFCKKTRLIEYERVVEQVQRLQSRGSDHS